MTMNVKEVGIITMKNWREINEDNVDSTLLWFVTTYYTDPIYVN